jgi:pimeloyl-ACP methyl ester carboxylesterase
MKTPWGDLAFEDNAAAGTPLVLLHGTGCDSEDWLGVLDCLPPEQRVVTIDFRGHGRSGVPARAFTIDDLASDVLDVLSRLSISRAVLAGHSLGGMVALAVARRSPAAASLVLLEGWTSLAAASQAFGPGRFYGGLSSRQIDLIRAKDSRTRERFDPGVWKAFWESVSRFDAWEYLQAARIPVLEVHGSLGRKETAPSLLRVPANPCIEWLWIEGAGHYLPHECPSETARACLRGVERARI